MEVGPIAMPVGDTQGVLSLCVPMTAKTVLQSNHRLRKKEKQRDSNKNNEEVAKEINADWLIYQTLDDLIDSVREGNPEIKEFETSIFTGKYFTPLVENYLEELEISRKDELKMQREKTKAKGQAGLTIFTAGIVALLALST